MPAAEGAAANGVLLLGEALGEDEARVGKPFQGKAGMWLTQALLRRDHKRDQFAIDNVVRCRPPDNLLNYQAYELPAIQRCAHHLDSTLQALKPKAVVAMGEIPLQRILHLGKEEKITPWRGYATWSQRYNLWVVPTFHPAYLLRGNQNLTGVFLHDIEVALGIAKGGFVPHAQKVWEDPPPFIVEGWVRGYEEALRRDPSSTWLAYDIETPYKEENEDEGALDEGDASYQILRIGFAYKSGDALSIPWQSAYFPLIRRLLQSSGIKLVWNGRYDNPRLAANDIPVRGEIWDLMWGWHVINSDLPKGLAFVAPMMAPGQGRWKHLAKHSPARYNGIDAEVTLRIALKLIPELHAHHLWPTFYNHIVRLDVVLDAMSAAGIPTDQTARRLLSNDLEAELDSAAAKMQSVVPLAAKRLKVYKGKPKGIEWEVGDPPPEGFTLVEEEVVEHYCGVCGEIEPPKAHFKVFKKKANPCGGLAAAARTVVRPHLARIETFVPSNSQLQTYATVQGHKFRYAKGPKSKGGQRRITFDDMALGELRRAYPLDPLYPLIADYREVEKLLGTYVGVIGEDGRWVGGPPTDPQGVIHTILTHAPSTLRLSSRNPNMQNIPRGGSQWSDRIKTLFVPPPGYAFFEADYKAIEAVLVGYGANSQTYTRLAKLGVHDFLNSHILYRQGKIGEPADISWSDADLKACFKELKARFDHERNIAKKIVHGSNYGMKPGRMRDLNPGLFPTLKDAVSLQGLYFEVCPDVRKWQNATVDQAEDAGYLRNPFGYLHRFFQVKTYRKLLDGSWESEWAEDAKRALAFLPQSTAAGLIKEALLRIWYESPWGSALRLQVHDSLLCAFPLAVYEEGAHAVKMLMSAPSPYLELPWAPGSFLDVEVECKVGVEGQSWGSLKEGRI